jgi:hypothetical protein
MTELNVPTTYLAAVAMARSNSETHYGEKKELQKLPLSKKAVKARNKNKRAKQARKKQRN